LSRSVNQLANLTNRLATWGLIIAGTAMSLAIFLQIIFRFVIYVPFPWSEEFARYLMVWMGMLGSTVALRHGRHIGISVIVEQFPSGMQRWIVAFTQLSMIAFLCFVAKEGWSMAVFNASQHSPSMEIPMFYPYLAIAAGAILMIIELAAGLLHEFFPTEAGVKRDMVSGAL
ncbi:MAG: TRAP transporter small permease, partial [Thermodesulfobacteriota bacterium]